MGEHLETTFGQVVGIVKEIVDNPFVFGSLQKTVYLVFVVHAFFLHDAVPVFHQHHGAIPHVQH